MAKELTNKQQAFIQEYCSNGYNASQAYKTAYPNCKSGYNAHGAKCIAKDSIKQAICAKKAEKQAKIEYDYDIAIAALDTQIGYLAAKASTGDILAIRATTALLCEKNAIAGLHKQRWIDETDQEKQLTDTQRAEAQRLANIRLAQDIA